MSAIPNGTYKAKALNYGITKSKAGDAQATINFRLLVNPETQETADIMWDGYLKSPKSFEITLDALLILGYTENTLDLFAEGKGLKEGKYVSVVVEEEEYNGRVKPKIKFINEEGSSFTKDFLAKNDAVVKLNGLNLSAAMLERKQKMGLAPTTEVDRGQNNKPPF